MARWKIKPLCFQHLFYRLVHWHFQYISRQTWKGLQLLAVDGTAFRVPDSVENRRFFGQHTNQHDSIASCRLLAWFDILNDLIVGVSIHKRSRAEVRVTYNQVHLLPANSLCIYDRGYASTGLLWLHQHYATDCLIRIKPEMSNATKAFISSGKVDAIVELRVGESSFYALQRQLGLGNHLKKHQVLTARLFRIELSSGESEFLMTTLLDQHTYKTAHFDWLYQKRWRVETCFDRLKNQLMLGSFSAYRLPFVWQDIWCSLIYHNLCSTYLRTAQKIKDLKVRPHNKLNYLINRNIASGILRLYLPSLLMPAKAPRGDPLYPMLEQMSKFAEAYRPNRKGPRKRKMMRINDRHQTEKNYKRAF